MPKNIIRVMAIVMGLAFGTGSALASTGYFYYSDGPWKGTVIDAETKEPISGAVVVAIWHKEYGGPAGPYTYFLDAKEVLTDKNGGFLIPKFLKLNLVPILSWIEGPKFIIFKPEYTTFPSHDYFWKYFPQSRLKKVDADTLADMFKKGVAVELMKLKTKEERGMNIPGSIDDVGADKLPLFFRLINEEGRNLGIGKVGKKR
jgi:hypothetical protein